jgi:hypothetical protein
MNTNEIFQNVQYSLTKNDLIPLSTADDATLEKYNIKFDFAGITKISDLADYLNVDINDIYINTKNMFSSNFLVIYKPGIYMELFSTNKYELETMMVKERLQTLTHYTNECITTKDFDRLFSILDKKILLITYQDFFHEINDKDKYSVFRDIYTRLEYGFNYIGKEFIEEILTYKKKSKSLNSKLNKICDKDGYVTVYRGLGLKSTPVEEAYSWTTNLYTALFFATRFNDNGTVYTAKIHKNKVIDYIESRREYEILTKYEDLENVEIMDFMAFSDMVEEVNQDGLLFDYYQQYKKLIKMSHYFDPNSIHGVKHAKRVLNLVIIIGLMKKLN